MSSSFTLDPSFVRRFKTRSVPFGFNGLGELVYLRTYSRIIPSTGQKEEWYQTIARVVEGSYSLQKRWVEERNLGWDEKAAQESAQEMYERMFEMKFLPPGRGLWAMGSPLTEERKLYAALNNCFSGDTKFLADGKLATFEKLVGKEVTVVNAKCQNVRASVRSFGEQSLQEVKFLLPNKDYYYVTCTPDHRWLLHEGGDTTTLRVGHKVPATAGSYASVESITPLNRKETVYCCVVPDGNSFTLEHGIVTGNCGFVSTDNIASDHSKPFTFLMDMSMLGCGIGFDTKGAGKAKIYNPDPTKTVNYQVSDDREGWVHSLCLLLESHFKPGQPKVEYDYSLVRAKGLPIKGFGGTSSGPEPLIKMLEDIRKTLEKNAGHTITTTTIVDIMNLIGCCVVAGNVRRCLPGDSLVHTKEGLVPIKDVKVGTEVLTSDGYRKVIDWFDQGEREIVKIITQDGEFRCTPNHRMAVMKDIECTYEWEHTEDLVPGDRLISTRVAIDGVITSLPSWSYDKPANSTTCKDISIPVLDEDMSWFIGLFMGDGYTYPNYANNGANAYVNLVFATHELDIAQKAQEQLQRFGDELAITLQPRKSENSIMVRCNSKQLAWYFDKNVKQANVPLTIPDWILRSTLSNRQAFIAGLLDADGCATNRPVTVVTTVYPDFAKQVQSLLYSCGVESRVSLDNTPPSREGWQPISHVNLITRHSVAKVSEFPCLLKKLRVGSRSQNANGFPKEWCYGLPNVIKKKYGIYAGQKKTQFNIDSFTDSVRQLETIPVEVVKVVPDGKSHTYDICVEGNHEFFVNGYLSHNTAEIAFGEHDDDEFINLKNYELNPERQMYGWVSNNSIFAKTGMDYSKVATTMLANGEPGIAWLDNMRDFSRMNGVFDNKDHRVSGGNPCLEQSLESYELCCLVETFPTNCKDKEDYLRTLKFAYLYAKTVTLGQTHVPETNRVLLRNRRIGCSISGIAQYLSKHGIAALQALCEEGYDVIQHYDKVYSNWLCIPRSVKTTSVKPSGTVSLLAGCTPGVHYPESRFYIRRMRLGSDSELIKTLEAAGYHVEDDAYSAGTKVVEIPVDAGEGVRNQRDVSMWEQLALCAFMQKHWADNQVSATITFDPEKEGPQISHALNYYQYQLKGISFLPRLPAGSYKQMPYEEINEDQYITMMSRIKRAAFIDKEDSVAERFCNNDTCELR